MSQVIKNLSVLPPVNLMIDTAYQATRPGVVIAWGHTPSTNVLQIMVGQTLGTLVISGQYCDDDGNTKGAVTAIVPAGYYYKVMGDLALTAKFYEMY